MHKLTSSMIVSAVRLVRSESCESFSSRLLMTTFAASVGTLVNSALTSKLTMTSSSAISMSCSFSMKSLVLDMYESVCMA